VQLRRSGFAASLALIACSALGGALGGGFAHVLAQSGVEAPGEPAWRKYSAEIYKAGRRMREIAGERLDRDQASDYDGLSAKEVTERIAPARCAR